VLPCAGPKMKRAAENLPPFEVQEYPSSLYHSEKYCRVELIQGGGSVSDYATSRAVVQNRDKFLTKSRAGSLSNGKDLKNTD
jgi:hypothetical protein